MASSALVSLLFLSACCKPKVEYVAVPCPVPPLLQRPALPITTLKPTDSIERERVLWVATVQAQDIYIDQLEKIMDAYRGHKEPK